MGLIDYCIVPSTWWETFALVISESWMFGRPVICADIGAMAERVTDEADGLHFSAGDARSLAAVIKRASTERGLWERLAAGIKPQPGVDVMTREMVEVYGPAGRHVALQPLATSIMGTV
jgi:glycosyltransferase involved in cell wall biosynthesis